MQGQGYQYIFVWARNSLHYKNQSKAMNIEHKRFEKKK